MKKSYLVLVVLSFFLMGQRFVPVERNQRWNKATTNYGQIFARLDKVWFYLKAHEKEENLMEVNLSVLENLDQAIALSEENLRELKKLRKSLRGK